MSDEILVERDGAIATVVLNKPDSHNAISLGMYRRIPDEFAALDADQADAEHPGVAHQNAPLRCSTWARPARGSSTETTSKRISSAVVPVAASHAAASRRSRRALCRTTASAGVP